MTRDSSLVSMLVSSVSGVAESLFATLFPSDCRFCRAPLINISRLPVCEACLSDIHPIEGTVCSVCGERLSDSPLPTGMDLRKLAAVCAEGWIRRSSKPSAYGSYDGGLRELIHLLKYEQVRPAAMVLGRMLAEASNGLEFVSGIDQPVVVPVPLHARKLRQRGFNQSDTDCAGVHQACLRDSMTLQPRVLERRARNGIANRPYAAPAPRKHPWGFCRFSTARRSPDAKFC